MIYARIDVTLTTHRKAIAAGSAMSTWTWGLLYTKEQQLDGLIPEVAMRLAWAGEKQARKDADKLVAVGLWEQTDGGWKVCKYADKNETSADVSRRRAETADRVAKHRDKRKSNPPPDESCNGVRNALLPEACNAVVPGSGSGSGSGSDLGEGVLGESPPAEDSRTRYFAAYSAGIARGKGGPWEWPGTKYAEWDLGKIIKGHGKDPAGVAYRGDQLLRYLEHTAADFASDVVERRVAKYYSAFEPKGCLKWLNEGELAEEARRVG